MGEEGEEVGRTGFEVMVRQRRISSRRASGEGCVRAVRIPRPPAFETALASSA